MSETEHAALDARRRRLLFRATHRGTQENDILIGGFVQADIATLTDPEITSLEALLELPENDLADWLTGRLPIPSEMDTPLLRRIKAAAGQNLRPLSRGAGEGQGGGLARTPTPPSQPSPATREREHPGPPAS